MSDKMREAFEAKFPVPDGVYWKASGLYYVRNLADDEAVSLAVEWNTMLSVWQAAHAAALPPGFVAVPVEPTTAMVEAARWMEFGEESSHAYPVDNVTVQNVYKSFIAARPYTQP